MTAVPSPAWTRRRSAASELRLLARALGRTLAALAFGVLPACLFLGVITTAATQGLTAYGLEFRGNLWRPGKLILEGRSPYEPARLDALETAVRHGHVPAALPSLAQAVYPAPAHVLAAPLALLPFGLAMAVFIALSVAAVIGALWILGVRDWRCYGVSFLSYEVIQGIKLGGVTPFLLLGLAWLWRYRDTARRASAAVALMIVAKLFLWPMVFWLLATGRRVAASWSAVLAFAVTVGAWASIGFRGLTGYPHLLSTLASLEQGRGDSVVALGLHLGLSPAASRMAAVGAGVGLLALTAAVARSGHERQAFVLALAAAFTLTPIVWTQYFMLVLVPIAISRPRLSLAWAVPLLLWLVPSDGTGSLSELAVHESALAATVALSMLALVHGARRWRLVRALALA